METIMGGAIVLIAFLFFLIKYGTAAAAPGGPPVVLPPPPVPPPVTATGIDGMILDVARAYGEDAALMKAICRQESNFDPLAINENDPSYGLGQIQAFWVWHFGLVAKDDKQAAVRLLLSARPNLEVQARILGYFRQRGFQFPGQVDIYNVGETLWNKGTRNLSYRNLVNGFYRSYGGTR